VTDPLTLLAELAAEVSELRDRVAQLEHEREARTFAPGADLSRPTPGARRLSESSGLVIARREEEDR
jgi:hypothetical protein